MGLIKGKFVFVIFVSFVSFSCLTPDIDEGEVNKLRPNLNQNANVNVDPNANIGADNEAKLNSLINLPFEPTENVFREGEVGNSETGNRVPGPTDRKLTAILKFSEADSKKLIAQLNEKANAFESKLETDSWFPPELIAKSQLSGDETIKGNGYEADAFFKSPYSTGAITHVPETDHFVLILQTK